MGLKLSEYWELTPKQIEKYVRVFTEKEEARVHEIDRTNHALGYYIGLAFNDPKNYPKTPFSEKTKSEAMTDEEMEKAALNFTKALGGKI